MLENIHSPKWADKDKTTVIVLATIKDVGEVEFAFKTPCTSDIPHEKDAHDRCFNGEFGEIEEYTVSQESVDFLIQSEWEKTLAQLRSIALRLRDDVSLGLAEEPEFLEVASVLKSVQNTKSSFNIPEEVVEIINKYKD